VNFPFRKRLRSADTNRYETLTTRFKFGERCFSYAGPKACNELPTELQDLTDHSAFRRQLKTFLFGDALSIHSEGLAAGTPRGAGVPPSAFAAPLSIHFLIFCSSLLFPFFLFSFTLLIFLYCPSDPFLPESSHSVSRREVVGGDRTWV